VKNITANDINLDFGVLGSKFVPNALAEMGKIEVAYNMINTTDFPGWGHWISQGANTLWEDWNGENSRNHIFFGDVSAWFYKYLGGIKPDEKYPGFKHFIIEPYFPEDLSWVKSRTESGFGFIVSNWKKNDEKVSMEVQIPFNTTATIRLPGDISVTIRDGDQVLDISGTMQKNDELTEFTLASGEYFINIE
jgi:alpha-L-rhamnosidase